MGSNPFHLSKTAEHGSPPLFIETARNLMGGIDLDPASSAFWNKIVKAKRHYTKRDRSLTRPWARLRCLQNRVFLNPPGDDHGLLVKAFWEKLVKEYLAGHVTQAWWVGFNMQQLTSLQIGEQLCPLDFPTVFPRRRSRYYAKTPAGALRENGPLHGSYCTWLPPIYPFTGSRRRVGEFAEADRREYHLQRQHDFIEHTAVIGKAVFPYAPYEPPDA